jgi:hypothetical protein
MSLAMNSLKKLKTLCVKGCFFVALIAFFSAAAGVDCDLPINGATKRVRLPFPYKEMEGALLRSAQPVFAGQSMVLSSSSPAEQQAWVSGLGRDSVLVALRNEDTGIAFVANTSQQVSVGAFLEEAKKALRVADPGHLKGKLFLPNICFERGNTRISTLGSNFS